MKRIPLLLLTGFLGSGKTTFLNWLLEKHPEKKISVILNEFGDIKLESQFVSQHTENIVELANGCMCCVAKSDIPRVINYILDHSSGTEYILVEASGLSDPDPIREALQEGSIAERIHLDATLCIVDCLNFSSLRQDHPIIVSQIGDADLVILSKVEEAGETATAEIRGTVEKLTPDVRVLEFAETLAPELFLDPGQEWLTKSHQKTAAEPTEHNHMHEPFQSFLWTSETPVDLAKLQTVIRSLPKSVIRAKGVVWTHVPDHENAKLLLQYVGTKLEIDAAEWKMLEKKQTTLLFLGTEVDGEEIKKSLDTITLL